MKVDLPEPVCPMIPSKLPLLYLDVEILQGGPLIGGALRINMR